MVEQLAARRGEIEEEITLLNGQSDDKLRQRGIPNHFASCRFSSHDLEAMVELLAEPCGDGDAAVYYKSSLVEPSLDGMRPSWCKPCWSNTLVVDDCFWKVWAKHRYKRFC